MGEKCVKCGSKENLEIDHIDPHKKSFSIGKFITHSWAKIKPEIDKCQLLCKACHKTKSETDGSLEKMKKAFQTRIPNQVPRDAEGRFIRKKT